MKRAICRVCFCKGNEAQCGSADPADLETSTEAENHNNTKVCNRCLLYMVQAYT